MSFAEAKRAPQCALRMIRVVLCALPMLLLLILDLLLLPLMQ